MPATSSTRKECMVTPISKWKFTVNRSSGMKFQGKLLVMAALMFSCFLEVDGMTPEELTTMRSGEAIEAKKDGEWLPATFVSAENPTPNKPKKKGATYISIKYDDGKIARANLKLVRPIYDMTHDEVTDFIYECNGMTPPDKEKDDDTEKFSPMLQEMVDESITQLEAAEKAEKASRRRLIQDRIEKSRRRLINRFIRESIRCQ